ncbi:MAG: 16S rRNA (cytosine(967)-C(5))-methyltransferase RsmB [Hydrogenophaga sp.]|uniref:16S rRNA (cytosine(967)-C(5))-methyltransferase RsmB n=1 Tax=Hydrogenophaga sp. TaxID=1904254 RepID=UPI00275F92C7|nr:16S rRNA (cytosine(967)-C(5))-methyltransferase RsmB [Hydrogenophaga sp.]MDP2418720.1 16S rRNA (cytosine(967)-C(5))-methyltransferase RsmB [Hydrogenophaga sp.]MDZ4187462.1 16S rRNA (cytosine(967)-C(5))-methyltransferase RsmB [Hydrogenophaga sp.]
MEFPVTAPARSKPSAQPSPQVASPSTPRLAPSLAAQLRHTARCVLAVEQGRSLSDVMPQVNADLRPGVQALTFHVLRHLGTARAVVGLLVQRKPEPAVMALLSSAVALLFDAPRSVVREGTDGSHMAKPDGPHYEPHTVVNQAVEAARQDRSTQRQAAFINACLRRFLREREALLHSVDQLPVARWNHPVWWIERLQRDHPEHWAAILEANNQPGPMALRVNRRKTTVARYQQALQALGVASTPVGSDGLVLDAPQPVERLPDFAQGHVSVQDAAAQMAATLLLSERAWAPTDRVLDACAAPGGKTAHLLEWADLDVLALDVDERRCERIHDNLKRLGLRAEVRCADAARPADWWDGRPFDAILLDAPCTASGIVRRHPDVRWLRRPSDVAPLVAIQKTLLEALWPLLKPGGRLLYGTCSVFRDEGEHQVAAFLGRHTDAVYRPSVGHLLPGLAAPLGEFNDNPPGGYDGFFYARIDKVQP